VNAAAIHLVPRTIINCKSTLSLRPPQFAGRASAAERVWEIEAAHDLMITAPAELTELLDRLPPAATAEIDGVVARTGQ
jgi:hypothetical protein